jgi:hypothetical protein
MQIGICGSSGRNVALTKEQYITAYNRVEGVIQGFNVPWEDITLVSGGSAWMDHIAVSLFKKHPSSKLVIHFPCSVIWIMDDGADQRGSLAGSQCAYRLRELHDEFTKKTGRDTLTGLFTAIKHPNASYTSSVDFLSRNLKVGDVDILIAVTTGYDHTSSSEEKHTRFMDPKSTGTAHCWKNSTAPIRIHLGV